ncbi:MAG: FAD-dependent oxidoreductase [Clostridiales bacterium]|jgi:NADPH-dependent 2,4-dienoyl-CoA reductase/sulfur reductase-like enzyme/rhodanese-related sulfurtransferase|nr:FAD-dependent oxidoreductase [Clostridiales bacterium]
MNKTIIVGGVAGGATAAARLRRLDESAEIVLFERGGYISFANCGLPYYIGGRIAERGKLLLQTPESFRRRFNVDVRVNAEVISIERAAKTVSVKHTLTGEEYTESYDKLILSPGGAPVRPPVEGFDLPGVFTLRSIEDADRIKAHIQRNQPKSAVIAGGGNIGVEMAENLRRAGLSVSIVELSGQVLASLDYDMACDIHRHLEQNDVRLYLNNEIRKVSERAGGLRAHLRDERLDADLMILAVGVTPDSKLARDAGLDINERGGIVTDRHMRASDEHIYAVGDAVETTDFVTGIKSLIPLASPANKQARVAADNICGVPSEYDGSQGSVILKAFDMTAAATGVNEKTAKRLGLNYDKAFLWLPSHAGYYPGGAEMSIKVIYERDGGKILGAQIVGFDGVDKRCDAFAIAIRAGMTAYDLTWLELCYAPPYSSAKDPVNIAGYVIENLLEGRVKQFHWHDADGLPRDGSVNLLDVRTASEAADGGIEGFVNIPLDSLRDHVEELDKTKPAYIYCHSGTRSYIAARILSQNGFDAYNLSGGYRLYRGATGRFLES